MARTFRSLVGGGGRKCVCSFLLGTGEEDVTVDKVILWQGDKIALHHKNTAALSKSGELPGVCPIIMIWAVKKV